MSDFTKHQTAGPMQRNYKVNEVYLSTQGEGIRVGTENVFVRFTGCNMRCDIQQGPLSPGGFKCDTEFESGRTLTLIELIAWIADEDINDCGWVILTGGEPGLQLTQELIDALHRAQYKIAIETNGSVQLPRGLDWVTVSPKVAEHCIEQRIAEEVKYVRGYGQALPKTVVKAEHYLISPAFNGLRPDSRTVEWCRNLIKGTKWKLSLQQHKMAGIR